MKQCTCVSGLKASVSTEVVRFMSAFSGEAALGSSGPLAASWDISSLRVYPDCSHERCVTTKCTSIGCLVPQTGQHLQLPLKTVAWENNVSGLAHEPHSCPAT